MESYKDFLDRINSFEKKELNFGNENFSVNKSVANKVGKDNRFKTFYGDTIVFNLEQTTKDKISQLVDKLYSVAGECFCEKLAVDTFHVTLHDLSNSPNLQEVAAEIFHNELKIIELKNQICDLKIKMRSKYIFNMVNTSLVLGLLPVDENEYDKLMKLYLLFDNVKTLPYPLTPHITLAYYNINGFDVNSAVKLADIVGKLNRNFMNIELNVNELYYQKFISMNKYINIVNLGK